MGDFIRSVYYSRRYRRLASLATINYCALIAIPQVGFGFTGDSGSLTEEILLKVDFGDVEGVREHCDVVEPSVLGSQDPIQKSREFLLSFIAEINTRYGLSLTSQEACSLVRNNLHLLQLSPEQKASLSMAIEFLEKGRSTMTVTVQETLPGISQQLNANRTFSHLYWPWEWNWFGLNKDKNRDKGKEEISAYSTAKNVDIELPGNCYFGVCEAFAGALLCIIPHPVAWSTGLAMIVDGGRRVVDGVIQLGDERRLDPNHKSPNPF